MTPREARLAIVQRVAAAHGVAVDDVLGRCKAHDLVRARWQAMREIRSQFGDGTAKIGRLFGVNRTSVRHALGRRNNANG